MMTDREFAAFSDALEALDALAENATEQQKKALQPLRQQLGFRHSAEWRERDDETTRRKAKAWFGAGFSEWNYIRWLKGDDSFIAEEEAKIQRIEKSLHLRPPQ